MLIFKRILAFSIDYIILGLYAALTFYVSTSLGLDKIDLGPVQAQGLGFLTLTLPVFCYFYFLEKSKYSGTIGKCLFRLEVVDNDNSNGIFYRTLLKIIPWEIGHAGVHWAYYYKRIDVDFNSQIWIWSLWILPQVLVLIYFVRLLITKGHRALYDDIAQTSVRFSK